METEDFTWTVYSTMIKYKKDFIKISERENEIFIMINDPFRHEVRQLRRRVQHMLEVIGHAETTDHV